MTPTQQHVAAAVFAVVGLALTLGYCTLRLVVWLVVGMVIADLNRRGLALGRWSAGPSGPAPLNLPDFPSPKSGARISA